MNPHPHGEQLSAYLDGMLDVARMREIAAHLGVCPQCRSAYQGLQQTKALLGHIALPAQPAPEFWANAYRRMRLEDTAKRPPVPELSWDRLRNAFQEPQRRWSAGLAAAAVIAAAIAVPIANQPPHVPVSLPNIGRPFPPPMAADTLDVTSLVHNYTEAAAHQPLADAAWQDMIAVDDSSVTDESGPEAAPDAAGDTSP